MNEKKSFFLIGHRTARRGPSRLWKVSKHFHDSYKIFNWCRVAAEFKPWTTRCLLVRVTVVILTIDYIFKACCSIKIIIVFSPFKWNNDVCQISLLLSMINGKGLPWVFMRNGKKGKESLIAERQRECVHERQSVWRERGRVDTKINSLV
jgi:hypothetical protein